MGASSSLSSIPKRTIGELWRDALLDAPQEVRWVFAGALQPGEIRPSILTRRVQLLTAFYQSHLRLEEGSRVALLCDDLRELVAHLHALWRARLIAVPLDPASPAERIVTLLNNAEAETTVFSAAAYAAIAGITESVPLVQHWVCIQGNSRFTADLAVVNIDDVVRGMAPQEVVEANSADDTERPALLSFIAAGSRAVGVQHSAGALTRAAQRLRAHFPQNPPFCSALPFWTVEGVVLNAVLPLLAPATTVAALEPETAPSVVAALPDAAQIFVSADLFARLALTSGWRDSVTAPRLKQVHVVSSSGEVSREQLDRFYRESGISAFPALALAEAGGLVSCTPVPVEWSEFLSGFCSGTYCPAGAMLPEGEIAVAGGNSELGEGRCGEFLISGTPMMEGYQASRPGEMFFDQNQRLHTNRTLFYFRDRNGLCWLYPVSKREVIEGGLTFMRPTFVVPPPVEEKPPQKEDPNEEPNKEIVPDPADTSLSAAESTLPASLQFDWDAVGGKPVAEPKPVPAPAPPVRATPPAAPAQLAAPAVTAAPRAQPSREPTLSPERHAAPAEPMPEPVALPALFANKEIVRALRIEASHSENRVDLLESLALRDPVVVVELLRRANSVEFAAGRAPCVTIQEGIIRLGDRVLIEAMEGLLQQPEPPSPRLRATLEQLRLRASRFGQVARLLAGYVQRQLSDEAEVVGLLSGVGEMLVAGELKDVYLQLAEGVSTAKRLYRLEREHGVDPERRGVAFLSRAGIPKALLGLLERETNVPLGKLGPVKPCCFAAMEIVDAFEGGSLERYAPGKVIPPKSSFRLLGLGDRDHEEFFERLPAVLAPDPPISQQNAAPPPEPVSIPTVSAPETGTHSALATPLFETEPASFSTPKETAGTALPVAVETEGDDERTGDSADDRGPFFDQLQRVLEDAASIPEILERVTHMMTSFTPFERTVCFEVNHLDLAARVIASGGVWKSAPEGHALSADSPLLGDKVQIQSFGSRRGKQGPFNSPAFALAPFPVVEHRSFLLYADCGEKGSLPFEARRTFRRLVEMLQGAMQEAGEEAEA